MSTNEDKQQQPTAEMIQKFIESLAGSLEPAQKLYAAAEAGSETTTMAEARITMITACRMLALRIESVARTLENA